MSVVARVWRGWTRPADAAAYEDFLRAVVVPESLALDGCAGAYVLRDDRADEVEFMVMLMFRDLAAVERFAGERVDVPVIPAVARALLSRFETKAAHYDVRVPLPPAG